MLNGGGINPDGLSLDLQFATDKTLTARRGPTPTFSRASSGTFVNANGLIVGKTAGTTSSITPNTQAIGSQVTVTVASGSVVGWVVGQAISLIVDTDGQDDPDATELWLLGNIVSTTDTTLVFSVTSRTTQAGSATSWTLGYRGPRFDHDPISRTNLLARSEEFGDVYWEKVRATISADETASPTGETTADKLINDTTASNNHRVDRGALSLNLNTVYTVSVFAKASEYSGLALGVDPSNPTTGVQFSLSGSGSVTAQNAGYTGTIQNFGNGWFRCTATFTSSSTVPTHRLYIYVGQNGTTFSYTGDGTSGIFIWGAQLEAGSTATSYIPTTTASVTIHDCRGLLIEEGRTNLFQYSEIFNEADSSNYWDSATANAVTSNQTTSPDGAATADLLTTSTASFDCFVRRTINWVGSTQYSHSIFLKRGPSNHRYVGLYIGAGITGGLQYPYFDFDNPTTVQIPSGTMVGTINSTRVDAYPNGWYRVSVTFTTAATPVTIYGGVYVSTSNGTLSSTPTAGLDCYIWGIQAETGSFPTSYIPTTTGTLARGADVCNITGDDFSGFYNSTAGTLLSEVMIANLVGDNRGIVQMDDGTNNTIIRNSYGLANGGFHSIIRANADASTTLSVVAGTASTIQKRVIAYEGTAFASTTNGGVVATATRTMPVGLNAMRIGNLVGGSFYLSGHIAAIRFYKKRLPNAKLVTLTT